MCSAGFQDQEALTKQMPVSQASYNTNDEKH